MRAEGDLEFPGSEARVRKRSARRPQRSGRPFNPQDTALLITDPQNDFLSPEGATWDLVGESVIENGTVDNIEALLKAAKENGILVFISPHYYYPTDHGWKFEGTLEKVMHDINMFDRKGPLDLEDFDGSGADWLEVYKPYINDGQRSWRVPTRSMGPRTTTSCCSSASVASAGWSYAACRPTCVSSPTYGSFWSRGSR